MPRDTDKIVVAYDGDCPFCSSYVRMQRLQDLNIGCVLKNFRDEPELVLKLKQQGMDPNNGMYVKLNDAEYFANEAMVVLSSLSTSRHFMNVVFKWCFKSKTRGSILYPVLRSGRNITLKVLGKSKL